MKELNFDTGLVSYKINGVEVAFNPTDSFFVERIYNTFNALDKKQDEYQEKIKNSGGVEAFEIARSLDNEMRCMIDDVLGEGISYKLFGSMNVYASNSGGVPLWVALLMSILGEVCEGIDGRLAKMPESISKYTEKYHK